MRQRTARKHGVKWREPLQIAYDPSLHAKEGMPECRHCGKRCGSHQGLKFHITHNACGWHQSSPEEDVPQLRAPSAIAPTPPDLPKAGMWPSTPSPQSVPTYNEIVQGGSGNRGMTSTNCNAVEEPQVDSITVQETHSSPVAGQRPPAMTPPSAHSTGEAGQGDVRDPAIRDRHLRTHADNGGGHDEGTEAKQVRDTPQLTLGSTALQRSSVWAAICSFTGPEALEVDTIAAKWKDHLAQHCCICNNWALDKSSVKCHLIRMHAKEWYQVAEKVADACKAHKRLFVRDTECQFCQKKVYGVERHALQCPVLFQACFMSCLAKAPSVEPNIWHRLRDLTRESCHLYLQGSLQITQDVSEPLNRFCVLCARQNTATPTMDIQAWRKHLQQVHGVTKTVLTTQFHEQAALVNISRPCAFCRMPFQKSPKLHRSKCLPLAQLLSVKHGYAGVCGVADCGSVGTVLTKSTPGSTPEAPKATKANEAKAKPAKFRKQEKGGGKGQITGHKRQEPPEEEEAGEQILVSQSELRTIEARPGTQSAGSGSYLRTFLLDHRRGSKSSSRTQRPSR